VAPERFVPVKVTGNVVPTVPADGVAAVNVGAAELTVKFTEKVCPPITRPRVVVPVAAEPVIVIEALTLPLVGVPVIVPLTPALPDVTAVAPVRFVPAKVTGNVVPTTPLAGVTEVNAGAAAMTLKVVE
jgi:hypothetical protein